MEDFIYILIEENIYNNVNERDVEVFTDLDEANNRVLELKQKFENETNECLTIEDETDEDEILKSYCAYENGNYNNNHYSITIYQREIYY